MRARITWFNIYLCVAACLLVCGCKSSKTKEKDFSSLELYIEVNQDGAPDNGPVSIYRESPVTVNVNKYPFLTQDTVEVADLIDEPGGLYHLRIKFTSRGTTFLDMYTSTYHGKRIAVFTAFDKKARWLASPIIRARITDGVLSFTPDATHDECKRIVSGLNLYTAEARKREKM